LRLGTRQAVARLREGVSAAFLGALVLDTLVGEPPERLHPVVWMGWLLKWLEAGAPRSERARLAYGAAAGTALPLAWCIAGRLIEKNAPWPLQVLVLKSAFAGQSLHAAARRVESSLADGDLDRARADLRWLVSRPTSELDDDLIAAAAIESLAENVVDSWVAPLLAYALFGLGGALAYRAANTADAMWGYHTDDYEWLGKVAARLDDVLNWLPARLAALLLVLVGPRPGTALRVWRRDARLTASPNAGQCMAATAGHLGVRLEKVDHYVLNRQARPACARDIATARATVARGMVLVAILCVLIRGMID
jgi:adenosylcobinamide-phosphate synthase